MQRPRFYYLRQLFRHLSLAMVFMSLCRVWFWIYNARHFPTVSILERLKIMIAGLRFDLSSVVYVNTLLILTFLLPIPWRNRVWYQWGQKIIFLLATVPMLILEIGDTILFPFFNRRSIWSDLFLVGNTASSLPSFFAEYWYAAVGTLLAIGILVKASPNPSKGGGLERKTSSEGGSFKKPSEEVLRSSPPPLEGLGEALLGILLYVLAGRGGLQLRPLTPIVATQYVSDMRLAPIVSNTTMNFLVSMQFQYLQEPTYFSQETLDKDYDLLHLADTSKTFIPYNVVVIALESFGKEFSARYNPYEGYTPFLDSISEYGYTCEQSYANGLRSTQGIVAITAGIPALMNDPLMISAYQSNQIESLASLLRKKGYETGFFHGSNVGSMEFEKYAKLAGFQHFYDRRAFPDQTQYDGNWGIWDAPFFQFFAKTLEKDYKQPFFSFFFSLTSHHPFKTEAWFEAKYPTLDPVNRSVLYTDYALRKFFETAQKMPWYSNTLFVICADHTGVSTHPEYQTKEGKYRVPIVIRLPTSFSNPSRTFGREGGEDVEASGRTSKKVNGVFSHIDILPSVLDYLHYDLPYPAFGNSIFQSSIFQDSLFFKKSIEKKEEPKRNYNYNYFDGVYQIMDGQYILLFDGKENLGLFDYKIDPNLHKNILSSSPDVTQRLERQLKLVVQRHHVAMMRNGLRGN